MSIGENDGTISMALANGDTTAGAVKVKAGSGLVYDSGTISISTDTKPMEGSDKLLTSNVIYSTLTAIYNNLASQISGITLDGGDGIKVSSNTISVDRAVNGGLKFVNNALAVSIDTNTIEMISDDTDTGKLKVKRLPKYNGQSSSHKNMVWGYADEEEESQGWLSIAAMGNMSIREGLNLDNSNVLRVSTATGTGLVFEGTGENAVLKISTGTGLDIDGNNNVIVTAATSDNIGGFKLTADDDSGLTMGNDAILKINVGTGLAINDNNEIVVSTGAGLTIDGNSKIVVSTGTGLEIVSNKINVVAATDGIIGGFKLTDANAHDSGLAMGEDAILKVSTGTGLDIDTNNKVVVTTAPYAVWASSISTTAEATISGEETHYVWGKTSKGVQGWIKTGRRQTMGGTYYYGLVHSNSTSGADLAEIYQSTEKLVPGDVVSIDPAKDDAIVKTKVAEDTMVAGVISTEPAIVMNQDEKGYKLALVGKVPTKVCNEGGAIKRGDLLVSASIPGYAKKAGDNPKVGTVIGKALENSDSQKGTILVLVNLQ